MQRAPTPPVSMTTMVMPPLVQQQAAGVAPPTAPMGLASLMT
jgi:hypothetical protein